jgi:hypothetical protein
MQDAFAIVGVIALMGGLALCWRLAFPPPGQPRRTPCEDWAELEACRERLRQKRLGGAE